MGMKTIWRWGVEPLDARLKITGWDDDGQPVTIIAASIHAGTRTQLPFATGEDGHTYALA